MSDKVVLKVHLSLLQFGPVRFDVVHDAVIGSRKCDPSDQQDDEDHVGEGRREVHDLKTQAATRASRGPPGFNRSKRSVSATIREWQKMKNVLQKHACTAVAFLIFDSSVSDNRLPGGM